MRRLYLLGALALASCVQPGTSGLQGPLAPPGEQVDISTLPGWDTDNTAAALSAYVLSCKAIALMPPDTPLGGAGLAQETAGQAGPSCSP
jgi:membrane-bound lytic murein transglycosylase A